MKEETPLRSYFKLIRAALRDDRIKDGTTTYESHHIVPKSFKKASTTVLLTPREHYAAHWYLMKHFDNHHLYGEKMMWAFHAMAYCRGKWLTASEYEEVRKALMPLWQRPKSVEHKRAIGDAHKRKRYFKSPETNEFVCVDKDDSQAFIDAGWENTNWTQGRDFSKDHRDKLSASTTKRLSGKRGLESMAAKGPYSVCYEEGEVVTAGSVLELSDITGLKHHTLYHRLANREGKYIGGFAVVRGSTAP